MRSYKNSSLILIISIFSLNILSMTYSMQEEGFLNTDEFNSTFFQGTEPKEQKQASFHQVPRLMGTLPENSQEGPSEIRFDIHSPYSMGGWIDTRWKYRKNITISSTLINSYLYDFPLFIDLKDEDLKNNAQVDGDDIFFTDTEGNVLDHEIELFNSQYSSTQAQLVAWVKTNLSDTSDTTVIMYYGNPTTANQENPEGVWDGYVGVWHLSEDPTGTILDSTSNNYDGTSTGDMTLSDQVDGQIDGSLDFDGVDDRIIIGQINSNAWTAITLEAWMKMPATDDDRIIAKEEGTGSGPFIWMLGKSVNNLKIRITTDGTGGQYTELQSTGGLVVDTWHLIVMTWDSVSEQFIGYIDGSNVVSTSLDGDTIEDSSVNVILADQAAGVRQFEGIMSEARILNVARSESWILTEYLNQYNPSAFYSVSIEETSPLSEDWPFPLFRYRKNITINSSEVSGTTLVNFPVLINIDDQDLHDPNKAQVDGDDILFSSDEEWVWTDELLQNGGFEAGTLVGWTTSGNWEVGTDPEYGGTGTQSGSYCAYVSSGGSSSDYIRQDVSISGYSSSVDTGKAIISSAAWVVSAEPGWDNSSVRIQFLDTSKQVISTPLDTTYLQTPDSWTEYSISNVLIPANTRYIRVWARSFESGWDAGSVDSFSLQLATLQTSNSAVKLDHEIELFNQSGNGTHANLQAWVKIPALRSGIDSNITLYYGNNAVRTQENPSTIWEDYEGIWHFKESSGTGSYIKDSTKNDHDGTPYNIDYVEVGKIGGMRNFPGASGSRIETSDSNNIFNSSPIFSFSFWIHPNYASDVDWETQSGGYVFYAYSMRLTRLYRQSWMSSGTGRFQPDIKWNDGTTSYLNVEINRQNWSLIHYSYDGQYLKTYVNGNPIGSESKPNKSLVAVAEPFIIGATSSQSYLGYLDEFRVSHTHKSADWILTEFNNQNNPDNFITVGNEEEYSQWWADGSFTKRRDINILKEKVSGNLIDFPILIEIEDSSLKSGSIQHDADDLMFTTSNGTKLDHETEYFSQNIVQGHLVVWVRLLLLSESEDTCISMYYGNDDLANQENPSGVWDSNYKGVWHLKENPSSSPPEIKDSTSNANHASSNGGMTSGDQVTGKINGALDFDGSDDYLSMGDLGTNGQTALTIGTWIYPTGTIHQAGLLSEVGSRDNGLAIETDWNCLHIRLNFGPSYNVTSVHTDYPLLNEYSYVVATYNGTHISLYVNGELATPKSGYSNPQLRLQELDAITITDWALGRTNGYFEGILDESRVSVIARSSEWIETEYMNQYDPSSFYSLGTQVIFDNTPPVIDNFGVDDLGTGIGNFWASISDAASDVSDAKITINSTEYSMSFNGSLWIYQLPVIFQENYEYLITNTSDAFGNYLQINTSIKNHTFNFDVVAPNVLARYFDHKYTFTANVTDSWGIVDTVIANVTYHSDTMPDPSHWVMTNYENFSGIMGYIRDNASIKNGDIKYQIIVNDTEGNYDVSSITESYVYVNHAPVAGNLSLNPSPIYSNSTLVLTYDYYDEETPDYESGSEICWYRNNGSGFQLNSTYHYPADGTVALERDASELLPDDQWYATVTPKDGELFGNMENSSTITIQNTPPSLSSVEIKPHDPLTTHDLWIEYSYSDYDEDNENFTNRQIEWYKVGLGRMTGFDNQTSISSVQTSKGDEFYVRMRVNDGISSSNWVNSSHIIIENSLPEAVNLTITPAGAKTNDTLVASWDMEDADTGDAENKTAAIIYWYKNGQLQASWTNSTNILPSNTTKNEWWHFKVKIFDGENYSDLVESPHIQIINTPPTASAVAITTDPMTTDDLTASWTFSDVDAGDIEPVDSWIIKWYKDNQLQTTYNNEKVVPSSATSKGDVWNFTLQVFDGTNYSIQYNSPATTVLNSPPIASGLTITVNPTTSDDLVATWMATDVDGDNPDDYLDSTLIKWYNWTGGGWVELISARNSTYLGWGNTSKNEVWRYNLTIFDGTNYSTVEKTSPNTTIVNSLPTAINPTFNKTKDVTTTDNINITYTYSDADNDPENITQRIVYWFTNGDYNASKRNNVTLYSNETKSGDFWQYILRVYDGFNWSQNFTSSLVVIGSAPNNVPEAQNLNLSANTNTTTENLILDYDYFDADGHLQSNRKIYWYKDGLLQPELNNSMVVDASLTIKDDVWNCTLQVFDGLNWSIVYNSTNITILNTAPTISDLSITVNPITTTDLVANWVGSDEDGDDLTFNITWYLDGTFNCSWETTSTDVILMAGNTTKNDKWYFSINASDGENFSSIVSLASNVTILNTAPVIGNLTITANPKTTNDLIAGWDDYDVDNDPLTPYIQWFRNDPGQPVVSLSDKITVESGNTSKNEVWWFNLTVYDGQNYSTSFESVHVQIQNTAPINTTSLPLPTDPAKLNGITLNLVDILNALEDPDGDIIELAEICWYRGNDLQSDLNDSLSVPGSRLAKGEYWHYSILPFDGLDYGEIYNSTNFEIINSKPVISTASFVELEARTIHNLTIYYEADDADDDSTSISSITWYWYNTSDSTWVPNGTYANKLVLPNTATKKGDRWYFEIQVTDGTTVSDWKSSALQINILNSKPWIDPYSVSIAGGMSTSEPLSLTYSWYDDDYPQDNETGTTITWANSDLELVANNLLSLSSTYTKAGQRWWVTITPNDGEEQGASIISWYYGKQITIGNTPPVVTETAIEGLFNGTTYYGTSFGTKFDLVLKYNASDIDGTQNVEAYDILVINGYVVGSEYKWYRNRSGVIELLSALNGETQVSSLYTKKGDIWWASIRPRDFYDDFGPEVNSTKITIGNTAPLILNLQWTETAYYTTNDLSFQYTFYDYDIDDVETTHLIYWYRNGTLLPQYTNDRFIPSQLTNKTEIWYVNISVWDGEAFSVWYQLQNITILNTPPFVTDVILYPLSPNTTANLLATWNFTDSDGDLEYVTAAITRWYRNGEYVGGFTSIPASMTNRGERWYFTVNVTDGYNYSNSYHSNIITILNTAPTVTNFLINNASTLIYTTDSLKVTWEFSDIDSIDVESSRLIVWYMNGEVQSQFTNQTSIPDSYIVKEQEWHVSISIKDTGGLWSETVNSSIVLISNSRPIITIHNTSHPEFIVEDEKLQTTNFFTYTDADGDVSSLTIRWYLNNEHNHDYDNYTVISADLLQPGDTWNYVVWPHDGVEFGGNKTSPMIYIESRPIIHNFSAIPILDKEGLFDLEVNVTDSRNNEITQVEYQLYLNSTSGELASFIQTSPKTGSPAIWLFPFELTNYSNLNEFVLVNLTVITEVSYSRIYSIRSTYSFNFTLEDKAPPRVVNAFFVPDNELTPANLTFYAEVVEYGSGVEEIILFYYFQPVNESNGGEGAMIQQTEFNWLESDMVIKNSSDSAVLYSTTVDFTHNNSDVDIIYRIYTKDVDGNINHAAFDIQNFPDRIRDQRYIHKPPGLPEWVLLVAGLTVFIIFIGSIVYVKFIRKPELVGLDKDLVLQKLSDISEVEIMTVLDAHTIGVIVSFFDQRHGPIPIIVLPEILKDNFSKLVELSDRSFSGTGFSDDFISEIPSSYDFVLAQGLRTSVMSFGFSLERPEARGGQENLTCNILIHKELFPLVNQFQDEIQRGVHTIHLTMDKDPSNKNKIRREVLELRKYVSSIILSYQDIYGTTEVIESEF